MRSLETAPIGLLIVAFLLVAVVITLAGTRLTHHAVALARRTGLGEAAFGALFVGATTSLPGIVTTVASAAGGHADLAVGNAVGGIAAQTVFLALADVFHRRANLEHAAASVPNLVQGALLTALLAVPLVAASGPAVTFAGLHPASPALVLAYFLGIRMSARVRDAPMWTPLRTPETYAEPRESDGTGSHASWPSFLGLAAVVAASGYVLAEVGITVADRTQLSETTVGAYFTAIATSIPELVLAIAAVRRGALNLAVGDILGGNCFDVLFLSFGDAAYRRGSLYHAIGREDLFFMSLTILLTAILLLGMLRREKHGIGNIGFESFLILVLYGVLSFVVIGGG